ncbi:MAG: diguanylate cyclase [Alphaproteobacteria bacterium]|nr:diguanylate cyclase [Alphaproteobacteria bacterium]
MTARILVADGIAAVRITLKVRLSAVCYDVTVAGSAAQILQQIEQVRPDLIILGTGFAEASSIEICARLARDRRYSEIPILMMVPGEERFAALQAGATATLEPDVDDQIMLARVRGILRDADLPQIAQMGMAEAAAGFVHDTRPLVVLIADTPGRALRWRQLLSEQMACRFGIQDPDEALGAATSGRRADLYLISADLRGRGDGLRLLSELRSRQGSRDARFVIATAPDRDEMAAIALDLGAGEVVPDTLGGADGVQATAMSLKTLLSRKSKSDQRRAEVQRNMLWAMTDPLTGLYNRRYALPKLGEIARDALLKRQGFAIFALDLDHFKTINDSNGHTAGDAVLAEVAQRLHDVLKAKGLVARMGGEEFLGILCDCTESEARAMAESLRSVVQDQPITLPGLSGGGQVRVTASVGIALVPPSEDGRWPEQAARMALERADRALLAAKAAGRNRVICSQPDGAAQAGLPKPAATS